MFIMRYSELVNLLIPHNTVGQSASVSVEGRDGETEGEKKTKTMYDGFSS